MSIHREGFKILSGVVILLAIFNLTQAYFFPHPYAELGTGIASFFVFLIFLQFFRKPHRKPVIDPNLVIAPADGKVVVIEKTFIRNA